MKRWRSAAALAVVLVLSGCAADDGFEPAAADRLQEMVLAATTTAQSGDVDGTLATLDRLVAELEAAVERGEVPEDRRQRILDAIDALRAYLTGAEKQQTTPAPRTPSSTPGAPAAPPQQPSDDGGQAPGGSGGGNSGGGNSGGNGGGGNSGGGNSGDGGNSGGGNSGETPDTPTDPPSEPTDPEPDTPTDPPVDPPVDPPTEPTDPGDGGTDPDPEVPETPTGGASDPLPTQPVG